MLKTCNKCKIEKVADKSNFYWRKDNNEFRNECIQCHKNKRDEYREKNRDKINKQKKIYSKKNKEYIRNWQNNWEKNKRIVDKSFALRKIVSVSIKYALKRQKTSKKGSCKKYLPYTIEQLKLHLEFQFEPWMNWSNHAMYNSKTWDDNDSSTWTWNIDHVIPQSDLPYDSMEHENFKKCWALENLRPYSAKQNVIDGSSRIRHKRAA